MDYQVIYTYQPTGIEWNQLLLYVILFFLGFGLVNFAKRMKVKYNFRPKFSFFIGYILCGIALILFMNMLIHFPRIIHNIRDYNNIIDTKNFSVVEGETSNYQLIDKDSRKEHELFSVNGVSFCFYDYTMLTDPHHSPTYRLIQKNGLKVRISYVTRDSANWIIKIEKK